MKQCIQSTCTEKKYCPHKILYPAKISFKAEGEIVQQAEGEKTDIKPTLQEMLKEILWAETK